MTAPPNLRFQVLGPLAATRDGSPLRLGGAKQRAVLATLLLHANHVVSRDRLVAAVWGDAPSPRAPSTLQVYVSTLRALLEPDLRARPADRMIATRSPGYVIRLATDQLDLLQFDRDAAGGRKLLEETRYGEAAEQLRAALALWRGQALADLIDMPGVSAATYGLDERRLTALEARIDAELALGRQASLVAELEQLTAEHPLREHLHGQLMLALARTGRQAEALDVYQRVRGMLIEELGVDPSPHLQELHQAVLAQDELVRARQHRSPVLLFHDSAGIQRTMALHPDRAPITVGRFAGNDLALPWDREVSRAHAHLDWSDGGWVLHDVSRNGSFVNGVKILRPQPLDDSDVLLFGRTAVTFRAASVSSPPTAGAPYGDETSLPRPLCQAVSLDPQERRVLTALTTLLHDGALRGEDMTIAHLARELDTSNDTIANALTSLYRQFAVDSLPFAERVPRLLDRARIVGLTHAPADRL